MTPTLNRFREPTTGDEFASCQSCGQQFHYTALDEDGFCPTCQSPKKCERCKGRGDIRNPRFGHCSATWDYVTCPDCEGTGEK